MNLSDEQREAINHEDGPARVLSVAGSGKTTVLVERARWLRNRVRDHEILIVTFSKRQKEDLQSRLSDTGVEIKTVHGFCYGFLGITDELVFEAQVVEELRERFPDLTEQTARDLLGYINFKNDTDIQWIPKAWWKPWADVLPEPASSPRFRFQPRLEWQIANLDKARGTSTNKIERFVETYRQERKGLTFSDFAPEVLRRMEAGESGSTVYQYVMVDEYQDLSPVQAVLVDQVASSGNLMVVGDDDQCIYSWRSANPEFLRRFTWRYPKARDYRLTHNFRVSPAPLALADKVVQQDKERVAKVIRSGSEGQGRLQVIRVPPEKLGFEIAHRIQNARLRGVALNQMALLGRTWDDIRQATRAMARYWIPMQRQEKLEVHDPYDLSPEILLDWLYPAYYLYRLRSGEPLDEKQVRPFLKKHLKAHQLTRAQLDGKASTDRADLIYSLSKNLHRSVDKLYERISRVERNLPGIAFLELVRGYDSAKELMDFLYGPEQEAVEYRRILLTSGLHACTVHQAKGLEWKVVFVLPQQRQNRGGWTNEEYRILYVALTRATGDLFVLEHEDRASALQLLSPVLLHMGRHFPAAISRPGSYRDWNLGDLFAVALAPAFPVLKHRLERYLGTQPDLERERIGRLCLVLLQSKAFAQVEDRIPAQQFWKAEALNSRVSITPYLPKEDQIKQTLVAWGLIPAQED